jgi:hypothetical protein
MLKSASTAEKKSIFLENTHFKSKPNAVYPNIKIVVFWDVTLCLSYILQWCQ